MRISNWSSDVCSSDLDLLVIGIAVAQRTAMRQSVERTEGGRGNDLPPAEDQPPRPLGIGVEQRRRAAGTDVEQGNCRKRSRHYSPVGKMPSGWKTNVLEM